MKEEINYEDFAKLELRVAKIKKVEEIEGANELYKIILDLGEEIGERTICSGLKKSHGIEELEGKLIIVITNLAPRKLMGIESQGMLLAADEDGKPTLLVPEKDVKIGSLIN